MAKKYNQGRFIQGSMGSFLNGNSETTRATESSANEFESLFLGAATPVTPVMPVMQPEIKTEPTPITPVEPITSEEYPEVTVEPTEEIVVQKVTPVSKKGNTTQLKKDKKPKTEKQADFLKAKCGRKKVYEEERVTIYSKLGKICYDKITELRYAEEKPINTYLCDLIQKEKEAYEKNQESYIAVRRKKAEAILSADKGETAAISFKVSKELASFLDSMVYKVRCTKELYIRTIVDMEYDKKFK